MSIDLDACRRLDADDPLAWTRERFILPEGTIYLDGNSLGALPRSTPARMARVVVEEWGSGLIRSWNDAGWIDAATSVGNRIAPLIGAGPGQVVVVESTSIGLYKALGAVLGLVGPGRQVVLTERNNFPTDAHVLGRVAADAGREVQAVDRGSLAASIGELGERLACVLVTQVDYRTGSILDIAGLCAEAKKVGALTVIDLSHSTGAFPLAVETDGVDFAVGCGYKYLNGGPGSPAFLFVSSRWVDDHGLANPLPGWIGHSDPFAMSEVYEPAAGIGRFVTGTPPILGLAALEEGVATFDGVDLRLLREKSVALCELFRAQMNLRMGDFGFELVSPGDSLQGGSQVAYRHTDAYGIVSALIAERVIGDFREPNIARFGFAPLYIRYVDVFEAVERLAVVMAERRFERAEFRARAKVT